MDILSAENIKKSFDEKVILDGVNLTLRQGELISLLGVSGAGKTTLIKKLIAEAYSGEKLVLIENEFGEINIDGGFLKAVSYTHLRAHET